MNIDVLYEDSDVVCIAKPAGTVVNSAETVADETIQEWFKSYLKPNTQDWQSLVPVDFDATFGTPEQICTERGGIVHRLDKDTSGVLLLAKNPGSLVALLSQFKQRTVEKYYRCLVHGKLRAEHDTILLPIGRSHRDRKQFSVVPEGRNSETEYWVESFFPNFNKEALDASWPDIKYRAPQGFRKKLSSYQGFSLISCKPKTGRTHQIRVHFAHLHHPLVSDQVYGGKKRYKQDTVWCARQFLHASSITFTHPRTTEKVTVQAALPSDLQQALTFVTAP